MKKKFVYTQNGKEFDALAEEEKYRDGKAVKITIYTSAGDVRNSIVFACQSEFQNYDFYQGKEVSELIDVAIESVCSGVFDAQFDISQDKVSLTIPFNEK
ncbi:MAG: hypothetical protein AB7S78_13095 [Candidatus Omnitrophota bacterium]